MYKCAKCGNEIEISGWCKECKNKYNRKYGKEYREKNVEKMRKYSKKYHKDNIDRMREYDRKKYLRVKDDPEWKKRRKEICANWYRKNKKKVATKSKEKRIRIKKQVFDYYGNKCNCCGESHFEFLAIDHINGGGNKHRKEISCTGSYFYNWLVNNNYPKGFQTLCHNCNFAKSFYGKCPHQKERERK